MNWINQWGLAAGYATRIDPTSETSVDNAVLWTPDGTIIDMLNSTTTASHAVWVNDVGQVSGWTASTTSDPCSFGTSLAHTQGFVWHWIPRRRIVSTVAACGGRGIGSRFYGTIRCKWTNRLNGRSASRAPKTCC